MNNNRQDIMVMIVLLIAFLFSFIPAVNTIVAITKFEIKLWHILVLLGIIILIWLIVTFNKFIKMKQRIKQSQGSIDTYLKQRFDLIPNLVEAVKGCSQYEKNVLKLISKLREDYNKRNELDIKEVQELNVRYSNVLALVERYPEVKASKSFFKLQKVLSKIESQLQAARRIYNMEVTEYNTMVLKIPSNLIAYIFGFKEKELFEIEKENIDI